MKTIFKTITLVLLVTTTIKSNAQASMDLFLISPQSNVSKNALGGGFNILSKPLSIGSDFELRFGGGAHGSLLRNSSISNVPLAAPQVGNSTVRFNNWMYGSNAMIRLSLPYSNRVVPYVDLFGGMQGYSCNMTVEPDKASSAQYSTTTQSISNMTQYNYGFTAGLIFSVSDNFKLDLGLTNMYSVPCGQIVDVNSARIASNTVFLNKIDPPTKTMVIKFGVIFVFDGTRSRSSGGSSRSCSSRRGFFGGFSGGGGGGRSGGKVNFGFGNSK